MRNIYPMTKRGKRLFWPVFALAWGNLAAYGGLRSWFGSEQINGHVTDGTYVVATKTGFMEVSPIAWYALYAHQISVIACFILLIIIGRKLLRSSDIPPAPNDLG